MAMLLWFSRTLFTAARDSTFSARYSSENDLLQFMHAVSGVVDALRYAMMHPAQTPYLHSG